MLKKLVGKRNSISAIYSQCFHPTSSLFAYP